MLIRFPLMNAAGEGEGGGAAAPKVREVELGSLKLSLPEDQAEALIKYRDENKKTLRETSERLGTLEAQAKAAADAERRATEEAERAKLTSKGQYDEALRMEQEKNAKTRSLLASRYRDRALESMVRGIDGVLPDAVEDVVARLSGSCVYDIETDMLTPVDQAGKPILGADGKPKTADAVIREFLDSKPHFRRATGSPGSGSQGGDGSGKASATATAAQVEAMDPMERAKFFAAGGKQTS
jgi:hypothetical protein